LIPHSELLHFISIMKLMDSLFGDCCGVSIFLVMV
jgi:hypothetical protein